MFIHVAQCLQKFLKTLFLISDFNVENHVKMGPSQFKTRPITESNIQECVSYIVSKYMASEYPPWEVKLIPLTNENSFYMLIRIHHLILDEQKNLKVSDMMLLDYSKGTKYGSALLVADSEKRLMKSPLMNMIRKPRNVIAIYEDVMDSFIQRWNNFVHENDSLEHHDGSSKKPTDVSSLVSSVVMMFLNTQLDYKQQAPKIVRNSSDPQQKLRFWMNLMGEEWARRQLSFPLIIEILLQFINPINVISHIIKFLWWTIITWTFLSPFYIWRELTAVWKFVFLNEDVSSNSIIGFLAYCLPLLYGAMKECVYFIRIIFNGPRLFIEETFKDGRRDEQHFLQNITLSGRKNVSWSGTISIDELKSKSARNHRTHSELLFSTVSSCLHNMFLKTKNNVPSTIRLSYRSVAYEYLFGTKHRRNGVLGLNLPIQMPSHKQLKDIGDHIEITRKRQVVTYLLSIVQVNCDFLTLVMPSFLFKAIINLLSKKYSLTITEVLGLNNNEPAEYKTRWNAEIQDVIFFRTPQANNSMSVTIQRFRDKIRMNVMCDSNLAYVHNHVSQNFVNAFDQIPVSKLLKF